MLVQLQQLLNTPVAVVTIGLLLILVVYLAYVKKLDKLQHLAYKLVCRAEDKFGGGTGGAKYEYVSKEIYKRVPKVMKIIITPDVIGEIIEFAVQEMKELLKEE